MKLDIKEIEVSCSEYSDYVLGCICNGDRYHVWLNRQTRELNLNTGTDYTTLFKNSVAIQGQEGYFKCRHIKGNSKFAKEVIDAMLASAKFHNLFDKAEEKQKQDRANELDKLFTHAVDYFDELGLDISTSAEVLGLAMQELQFAIVRINNAQEYN